MIWITEPRISGKGTYHLHLQSSPRPLEIAVVWWPSSITFVHHPYSRSCSTRCFLSLWFYLSSYCTVPPSKTRARPSWCSHALCYVVQQHRQLEKREKVDDSILSWRYGQLWWLASFEKASWLGSSRQPFSMHWVRFRIVQGDLWGMWSFLAYPSTE